MGSDRGRRPRVRHVPGRARPGHHATVAPAGGETARAAGRDPGGIAIALIVTGIDYTHPEIKDRLARDGEGEIIGLDLIDGDNRPYAATSLPGNEDGAVDTILARRILSTYRHARLVPIRVDPNNKVMLARALAFAASTPARIVAVPLWGDDKDTWEFFSQAAEQIPDHLLILPAGDADAVRAGPRAMARCPQPQGCADRRHGQRNDRARHARAAGRAAHRCAAARAR